METLKITKTRISTFSNNYQFQKSMNSLILNFTTMKKQISLMIVAIVASTLVAFGQGATHNSIPRPLTDCVSGPLNPIAGVEYNYSAILAPEGGNAYWFATFNNTSFIAGGELTTFQETVGGDFVLSAENYRNPAAGAVSPDTTKITWNAIGLSQITVNTPLFLAVNYTAPATGCANNLKVYKINPVNAFLVNILNLESPTYDSVFESCFSDIESAEYNLGTSLMEYNFGKNVLAFEVVAANFTEHYDVSFRIAGLQPDQDANIYWSYSNDFANATLLADGPYGNEIVSGPTVATTAPSTGDGVSIFVWLEVNNNNYEGLSNTPITLAVAGINSANQANIRWDNCATSVSLAADFGQPNAPDYATHILNARPTVTPGAGLNFENQVQP